MPNRVFLTREFDRWASRAQIADAAMVEAVEEMERGLVGDALGSNVFKKRIARRGEGKSGGYRTILAFGEGERTFFLKGFAKNDQANVTVQDLSILNSAAKEALGFSEGVVEALVEKGTLRELRRE